MSTALAIIGVGVYVAGVIHCLLSMYASSRRSDVILRETDETLAYIEARGRAPAPRCLLAYMGHVSSEPRTEWWWRYGR